MVGDSFDNMLDLIYIILNFVLPAPFGKAMLAIIVAYFGNMPVDDNALV